MVEKLREEFAKTKPALYTLGVEIAPTDDAAPGWFEEDSIRGDYLRAIREWRIDPAQAVDVEVYLPDSRLLETLETDVKLDDVAIRSAVLEDAAVLGVELLSADDPGPLDRAAIAAATERRKEARG
jgi:hypothetical protein